jgi:tRNA 2-selenouridine synthase
MMVLIAGPPGAGKTALLHALQADGEHVIDLEGLAQHRGSAFGATGRPQPPHGVFVNAVRAALAAVGDQRVWLEDEGPYLGSVGLPLELYARFPSTPVVVLEPPRTERVHRLIETYGSRPDLEQAVARIEPRLGADGARRVRAALAGCDLALAATVLVEHYDRAYRHRTEGWLRPVIARYVDGRLPLTHDVLAAVRSTCL